MMQRLRASLSWLLVAAFVGVNLAFIAHFLVVSLARDTYPFELEWFEGLAIDHAWRIIHRLPIYGLPDATFAAGYYPPLFYFATLPFIVASGWTLWGARLVSWMATVGAGLLAARLIRPTLREGVFVEGDFEPGSFDLICCFQTMEHVSAPRALAESCWRLLRPGGLLSLVTHDYRAPINRLLGRRSPIIDVAHLQLYCRSSLTELLRLVGLELIDIRSIKNTYPLDYWVRLSPLPMPLKARLQAALTVTGAGAWKLGVGVGNLMTIGRKPADVGLRAPGG